MKCQGAAPKHNSASVKVSPFKITQIYRFVWFYYRLSLAIQNSITGCSLPTLFYIQINYLLWVLSHYFFQFVYFLLEHKLASTKQTQQTIFNKAQSWAMEWSNFLSKNKIMKQTQYLTVILSWNEKKIHENIFPPKIAFPKPL